eukprot:scaffold9653_cov84-Amphora_coffeaeformis.AAC.1
MDIIVSEIHLVGSLWSSMPEFLRKSPMALLQVMLKECKNEYFFLQRRDVDAGVLAQVLPDLVTNHRKQALQAIEG